MGCIFAFPNKSQRPIWDGKSLSSGGDKDIFHGTLGSRHVAVCVAKNQQGGSARLLNEAKVFRQLGEHPHIITMYCSGMHDGRAYLALELVEPIGFDLDSLMNQYSFAGTSVPSSLMGRLYRHLSSALSHMHKRGIIHRDLKAANVLVDAKHHAKLIDMGIACKIGTRDCLRASYLAPELCRGVNPLGPAVDCWGLGLLLHQVYQRQWRLVSCGKPLRMLPGRPSTKFPMEEPVQEAMLGLLQFDPNDRWTLPRLEDSAWLKAGESSASDWHQPAISPEVSRTHVRRYVTSKPPPTALAVFITAKNHKPLIGKPLRGLGLSGLGVTVLLVSDGRGSFNKLPGADTIVEEGHWLYFGVPEGDEDTGKAIEGITKILDPKSEATLKPGKSSDSSQFRALSPQEVTVSGKLVEFTVEFDCFSFPEHIGSEALIGPTPDGKRRALDLRRAFGVNLVGIQRIGETEPEWWPGKSAIVHPGDLGLVVRQPCVDGSTLSTLTDEDLAPLFNPEDFEKRCPPITGRGGIGISEIGISQDGNVRDMATGA
mmetsp:Transcript_62095/g.187329  ORF Transcript_62095/g.187329 Transcript_62095/m.187329 type:complete len:541 (+) Transcript_62095:36-1658(+)